MTEQEVKKRLKIALEAHNENPTRLSRKYGVNQTTLNNQVNGDTAISLSTILLILDVCTDVSAEWLLRGTGEMTGKPASESNSHNVNSRVNCGNNSLPEGFVRELLAEKDKQIQMLLSLMSK